MLGVEKTLLPILILLLTILVVTNKKYVKCGYYVYQVYNITIFIVYY